jgi:hypothetical protein
MVVVQREAELLEVVGALDAAGRLSGGLDGRQQQRNQDGDDRDHHQKLDQRKSAAIHKMTFCTHYDDSSDFR